jgi:hypothetical protein
MVVSAFRETEEITIRYRLKNDDFKPEKLPEETLEYNCVYKARERELKFTFFEHKKYSGNSTTHTIYYGEMCPGRNQAVVIVPVG